MHRHQQPNKYQTLFSLCNSNKVQSMELPLPPKTSKRFSTIVAVWPHLGGGRAPETDNSVHSSETDKKAYT